MAFVNVKSRLGSDTNRNWRSEFPSSEATTKFDSLMSIWSLFVTTEVVSWKPSDNVSVSSESDDFGITSSIRVTEKSIFGNFSAEFRVSTRVVISWDEFDAAKLFSS